MGHISIIISLLAALVMIGGACYISPGLYGKWQLEASDHARKVPVGSIEIGQSTIDVQFKRKNSTFECILTDYSGTFVFRTLDTHGMICIQWFQENVNSIIMTRLNLVIDQSVDDFFSPQALPEGFTPSIHNACYEFDNAAVLYMKYTS